MFTPLSLCILAQSLSGAAWASPAEAFGFGARAVGRGGAGVAMPGDAGSAMLNPASLADRTGSQAFFNYALVRYSFEEIPEVYWDTNRDGLINGDDAGLNVNGGYDPSDHFSVGIDRSFKDKVFLGFSILMPKDRLLRLHTIEPTLPNYMMYGNRYNRYGLAVALAGEPLRSLQLGAGVQLLSHSVLDVKLTIDATVSGSPSDGSSIDDLVSAELDIHDVDFDLISDAIPTAGLRWDVGELVPALDGLAVGASWRGHGELPVAVTLDGQVNTTAEDIGELDPITAVVLLDASALLMDHYMPTQIDAGVSYTFRGVVGVYGDVIHTRWAGMKLNVTTVQNTEIQATLVDLSDVALADGNGTEHVVWRNTTGFRAGADAQLPEMPFPERLSPAHLNLRAGFGVDPSPLVQQGADTALLDADRLIFSGGLGLSHGPIFDLAEGPIVWDLFTQVHVLAQGELDRPPTAEPRAGYPVAGGNIPIGGRFFTAGLQWSMDY